MDETPQTFYCQHCDKLCKTKMSHIKHELYCKSNPNHRLTHFANPEFKKYKLSNPSNQHIKARQNNKSKLDGNTLDIDYFKVIDTPTKAYLYGLIFADGCIMAVQNKTGTSYKFAMQLHQKDEELIDLLKNSINSPNKKIYDTSGITTRCSLKFNNADFCQNLIDKGITPQKTGVHPFPFEHLNNDDILIHCFLLGYFDGDGTVCKGGSSSICSKNKDFLLGVKSYFNLTSNVNYIVNPYGSVYSMGINKPLLIKCMEYFDRSLSRKRVAVLDLNRPRKIKKTPKIRTIKKTPKISLPKKYQAVTDDTFIHLKKEVMDSMYVSKHKFIEMCGQYKVTELRDMFGISEVCIRRKKREINLLT